MKKILFAGVLVFGMWTAPVANADDDTYLQYLISHGVPDTGPGTASSTLVQTGHDECAAIREGKSDSFLMGQLINAYAMGKAQAQDIVYAGSSPEFPETFLSGNDALG
jgi:hypothetical protein